MVSAHTQQIKLQTNPPKSKDTPQSRADYKNSNTTVISQLQPNYVEMKFKFSILMISQLLLLEFPHVQMERKNLECPKMLTQDGSCLLPLRSDTSRMEFTDELDAIIMGRCYATCVQNNTDGDVSVEITANW